MLKKAVFLDRDGVINSDVGHYYIYRVEDFEINPGIFEGLKLLRDAGFELVVVTNQGGVAKGVYSMHDVEKVHGYLNAQLAGHGIWLTDIFVCPHHESIAVCDCRKPSPKMILDACQEYGIDPHASYLIGDSARDIEAGQAAGLRQCFRIQPNTSIVDICLKITQAT
ncbi:MAG: HAD family hydrolase [Breznakibacter sp.]